MEIEAKFAVPNRAVYRQMARLQTLAGYALVSAGAARVADRYFDTADGRLQAAGYACRLRTEGETVVVTLKGLGGAEGAVHRRVEEEVALTEWTAEPTAWPDSPARTLAIDLAAGTPLAPLFDLTQRRARADVLDGDRRVAQLSLDYVRLTLTGFHRPLSTSYYELEVELVADGTEADLVKIADDLAQTWNLAPEPRSKFERGLAIVRERRAAFDLDLTPEERRVLAAHAASEASPDAGRSAAVLGWVDGLATREIAASSHLSPGRVRAWVCAFRERRLGILSAELTPAALPAESNQAPASRDAAPVAETVARPRALAPAKLLTVNQLCRAHKVDLAHARFVADQAQLLFDVLKHTHRLPKRQRKLLRSAAWLLTVGAASDPERPWQAGRDFILAQPLRSVTTNERLALASIVALGGGKVRVEREITLSALDDKLREHVMALAALVRIAEALDFSRTQATEIQTIEDADARRCDISVTGSAAAVDAAQANSQADLWYQLFKQELVFAAPSADSAAEALPEIGEGQGEAGAVADIAVMEPAAAEPALPAAQPIAADDPMSEAGRKLLYLHFTRMLANEAGTRLGQDPEALHDMRVATRRMRAAFALFAGYFDKKALMPFKRGLQRTGRTLGAVRDLDVLLDKARAYAAELPAESADSLDPLIAEWETARDVARRQMLEYLDGGAYRRFVADFEAFLTQPGAGAQAVGADDPMPCQVCHVVPSLIMTRYESVRAYERVLSGAPQTTYHALRINCKQLRYALEFFRELLGEGGAALIKQVTGMQDLLGELQDAHVAEGLLAAFLVDRRRALRKKPVAETLLPGVDAYLDFQRNRQAELLADFPAPWADLIGIEFRRELALAIAAV